jgi:uncharacterized protein (DUF1697 family)
MNTYVALLRGINVGGHKLIKMQDLVRIFASAGCKNVRTFQQAGNVIFESRASNAKALTKKIESALKKNFGYDVTVVLRRLTQLQEITRRDPFTKFAGARDVMMLCVVFLAEDPQQKPTLPVISKTENVEVFEIEDAAAFVVSRRKKNGWFGFPNAVVEKALGVAATTRQWTTVQRIVQFAASHDRKAERQNKK